MLDLMKVAPRTTGELCDHFPELDRCTVMQHLSVLEDAELVIVRRRGRYRWNHLNPLPIKEIHDRWIGRYATGAVDLLVAGPLREETPTPGCVTPRSTPSTRRTMAASSPRGGLRRVPA